jgi:hypothetical protein
MTPENTPKEAPPKFEAPKVGADGLVKTLHHPEGIDPSDMFFNEERVSSLILQWKKNHDIKLWQEIVKETIPLIDTLILHGSFTEYDQLEALRSECVIKLHKLLDKFDPNRGRAFTIFSISFKNFLLTYSQKVDNKAKVVFNAEDEFLDQVEGSVYIAQDLSEAFKQRVLDIETRFFEKPYADAMRYLVNYFIKEGFDKSKTKLCATLASIYDITPDQAYFLYDYTLIKLRSALFEMTECIFTEVELLRLSKRWTFIPDMVEHIGLQSVIKLCNVWGGINVTFPTRKDIEKLIYEKRLMDRVQANKVTALDMKEYSEQHGGDAQSTFERVSDGHAKGHDDSRYLFEEERGLSGYGDKDGVVDRRSDLERDESSHE